MLGTEETAAIIRHLVIVGSDRPSPVILEGDAEASLDEPRPPH
jgi:hypothetical protein